MSFFIPGLYEVPQGHIAIVERFGKFDRILTPGLNWINPFTSSVKNLSDWRGVATKCGYLMELTQQQLETEKRQCHTKDHVMVHASATIQFKIIDPKKALYEIDLLPNSIQDICSKELRSKIGSIPFDEVFSSRKQISQSVMDEVAAKVNEWGVLLLGVEIGELDFDPDISNAMKKRRIAEAEKEASVALAQADLEKKKIQSQTDRLQAESEAAIAAIRSNGQANALNIESTAKLEAFKKMKDAEIQHLSQLVKKVDKAGAVQMLTATQAVEAFKALSDKTANKMMFLPTDFKGMLKLVESASS